MRNIEVLSRQEARIWKNKGIFEKGEEGILKFYQREMFRDSRAKYYTRQEIWYEKDRGVDLLQSYNKSYLGTIISDESDIFFL